MSHKPKYVHASIQNGILIFLALFLTGIIFTIDVNVPLGLAVGAMYSIVIFYSWLLPGRQTPLIAAAICTLLILFGLSMSESQLVEGNIVGINTIISVIVIWICAALVMMAKRGFESLEEARDHLEEKVEERTHELRVKQKLVEQSESRYRNLLESAPDAIVISERNGIIQLVNRQITNVFGYDKDELVGTNVEQLIPERYRRLYLGRNSSVFDAPEVDQNGSGMEIIAVKKSGEEFPIEVSLSPLETDQGMLVSAAIRDITFRKDAERSMEEFSQQLQNKNKELEQFTYVASHDLQEPLRTITSFSEILANQYKEKFDETGNKSLQCILEATGRMSGLIKGLLDYGRLGKSEEKTEIDCYQLIEDLKNDLATAIKESDTDISAKRLPKVKGYEVELRLLFQNIISNSMKFRNNGVAPKIKIRAVTKKNEVVFAIEDNGIGIAKEHKDRIFEIFQRLHNRSEFEGTGIGLAHCRKIVELHGGRIWVESELGKGSSFYFTIPKPNNHEKA